MHPLPLGSLLKRAQWFMYEQYHLLYHCGIYFFLPICFCNLTLVRTHEYMIEGLWCRCRAREKNEREFIVTNWRFSITICVGNECIDKNQPQYFYCCDFVLFGRLKYMVYIAMAAQLVALHGCVFFCALRSAYQHQRARPEKPYQWNLFLFFYAVNIYFKVACTCDYE